MPLEAPYNPRIDPRDKRHIHAYDLAKTALAVWRVDHAKFSKMDDWLFEVQPRKPEDARAFAVTLVGEEALKKAEADPWIVAAIKRDIRFYTLGRSHEVPELLMHKPLPAAQYKGAKELFAMLERELEIRPLGPDGKPLAPAAKK